MSMLTGVNQGFVADPKCENYTESYSKSEIKGRICLKYTIFHPILALNRNIVHLKSGYMNFITSQLINGGQKNTLCAVI